jgi:hypothetical protein
MMIKDLSYYYKMLSRVNKSMTHAVIPTTPLSDLLDILNELKLHADESTQASVIIKGKFIET